MASQSIEDWIQLCYDSEFAQRCGARLSKLFSENLARLQADEKSFQDWVTPEKNVARCLEILGNPEGSSVGGDLTDPDLSDRYFERFAELVDLCLRRGQGLHHPRCAGHQVPAVPPLAAWFDAMTSLTNQVQGVYEMGPWSVAVERAILQSVGETMGFPKGQFGSLVTSGGSLANLTALLAARQVQFPNVWKEGYHGFSEAPVLVVHQDVHYCINRAAGVMGLGTNQLIDVPLDSERRMDAASLEAVLEELEQKRVPVLAVVSVAGSTACGAFDSLPAISEVCKRYGKWLHVDAAHGGALKFSQRHQGKLDGLNLADSVVVDAHKMMFVPAVCALLFFKEPSHQFAAFDQEAPYLFDPSEPSMARYDNAVVTLECTKRASAMGIWGVWSIFGVQFFEVMVDRVIEIALELFDLLKTADDFEIWKPPVCNIVLFRFRGFDHSHDTFLSGDDQQLAIRRKLLETGAGYLTQTKLDGRVYLRATIMNPMMKREDLQRLLEEIRVAAKSLAGNQ